MNCHAASLMIPQARTQTNDAGLDNACIVGTANLQGLTDLVLESSSLQVGSQCAQFLAIDCFHSPSLKAEGKNAMFAVSEDLKQHVWKMFQLHR